MPIDRENVLPKEQEEPTREPYATPELTIHGTVEELTRYVSGGNTDGFGGSEPGMEPPG